MNFAPKEDNTAVMIDPSSKPPGETAAEDPGDENERPTINPPFDIEAYARATTSPEPDTSTTRPPPAFPKADASGSPPAPSLPPVASVSDAEVPRVDPSPSVKLPFARSPSALWMVDALVPSGPPAAQEASDASSDMPPQGRDVADRASAPEIIECAVSDPAAEMRERASLGDYTGALEMADIVLADDPGNIEATECVENCRSVLEKMYCAKLGPLDRAPIIAVPRAQLRWLSIDHRAGFILSLIDGASPIEMIIDVSGMPKLDALRILHELVQQRIVSFKS